MVLNVANTYLDHTKINNISWPNITLSDASSLQEIILSINPIANASAFDTIAKIIKQERETKLLSIASNLAPSQQLTIQQLENNNYPLNNNISKVITNLINATTSKKSTVEREADEIV